MMPAQPEQGLLTRSVDALLDDLPADVLRQYIRNRTLLPFANNGRLVEAVEDLFGPLTAERRREIAEGISLVEVKNWGIRAAWDVGGLEAVVPFVRCAEPEKLQEFHKNRRPAILAFMHLGARFAVGPALRKIGIHAAIIAIFPVELSAEDVQAFVSLQPGLSYLRLTAGGIGGATAFMRAIEQLRKGGVVAAGIDGQQGGSDFPLPFLGRRISVKRGIAALARLTGAPIIPIALAFSPTGWNIDFQIGEPLTGPANTEPEQFERVLTEQVMHWFEAYVREHPEQLRTERLGWLWKAPRVPQGAGSPSE